MLKALIGVLCPGILEDDPAEIEREHENPLGLRLVGGEGSIFFERCGHRGPSSFEILGARPCDATMAFSYDPKEISHGVIATKDCPQCYFSKLAKHAILCDSCCEVILPGSIVFAKQLSFPTNTVVESSYHAGQDPNHDVRCAGPLCGNPYPDSGFQKGLWTTSGFIASDECSLQI